MQSAKTAVSDYPPADFDRQLLRDGAVALFYQEPVLEEAIAWFHQRQYQVHTLNCAAWQAAADVHNAIAQTLAFPDYYGRNLNALRDCLSDLDIPGATGMVVALLHYDAFAGRLPDLAHAILDVLAKASWDFLLDGRKFITLVQSDDPRIQVAPLGCRQAIWNPREWLNKSRGLG